MAAGMRHLGHHCRATGSDHRTKQGAIWWKARKGRSGLGASDPEAVWLVGLRQAQG